MDSLFGRKKGGRPRQGSVSEYAVPYDRVPASPKPTPVSTVSHGLRGSTASLISAPITNPTLTASGTEINKYAIQRAKQDRARAYELSPEYNTAKSPNLVSDFGQMPPASPFQSAFSPPNSASTMGTSRPMSNATTRSDSNRGSKYAPSIASSDGGSHLSHHFYHSRHANGDDFNFPRPDTDEEIEILFANVKRTRDLGDMPNMTLEQKWHIVYNDEHIRWEEDKQREKATRRQNETGQAAGILQDSPEWFIRKFLDKTITAKQAGSLLVSLRSKEMRSVLVSVAVCLEPHANVQLVPPLYINTRHLCTGPDPHASQQKGRIPTRK